MSKPGASVDTRVQAIVARYPAPTDVDRAEAFYQRYRATGFERALLELMTPEDKAAWRRGSSRPRLLEDYEDRVTQGQYIIHMFAEAADDRPAAEVRH